MLEADNGSGAEALLMFFQFCSVAAVDVLVEHPLETFMLREFWNLSREFFSLINYIEEKKTKNKKKNKV